MMVFIKTPKGDLFVWNVTAPSAIAVPVLGTEGSATGTTHGSTAMSAQQPS